MALTVKLLGTYKSKKTGTPTFRYGVSGSVEELAAFEAAQGNFHRTDDQTGQALWFTTRCIGPKGTLIITQAGNIVPDMSEYDQAASLAAQFGGNLGQELARAAAQKLMGGQSLTTQSAPLDAPEKAQDPLENAPIV